MYSVIFTPFELVVLMQVLYWLEIDFLERKKNHTFFYYIFFVKKALCKEVCLLLPRPLPNSNWDRVIGIFFPFDNIAG